MQTTDDLRATFFQFTGQHACTVAAEQPLGCDGKDILSLPDLLMLVDIIPHDLRHGTVLHRIGKCHQLRFLHCFRCGFLFDGIYLRIQIILLAEALQDIS